jgi:hypothetical protein
VLEGPAAASDRAATSSIAGQPVILQIDQAKVLKLPEKTATLVAIR